MPKLDPSTLDPRVVNAGLRNESALLIAARTISHSEVGRRMNIPKQTLQDWRESEHKDACLIYAAYGLKLVPVDDANYSSADIAAMAHLAQKGIVALKPLSKRGAVVEEEAAETEPGPLGDK